MDATPDTQYEGTFNLTETTYVEHMWYVAGDGLDLLAMLYQDKAGDDWKLTYRFRYYNPDSTDPFDGKDRKHVYQVKAGVTEEDRDKLKGVMETLLTETSHTYPRTMRRSIPVQGNSQKFMAVMVKQPFAHVKVVGKEGETVQ